MTRPTDWHVLDLDGDPTPGDPVRVRQLASRFHDFAETAHRAKLAVESLQGDGALLTWVGKSGDAFREQFGDFPNQVTKLYRSHLMVGDALDTFAPELERAQAQADRALADGRAAAEKVSSLKGSLSVAQLDFTGASKAAEAAQAETVKPDPDQVKQAVRDATAAQQRLSAAQGQVDGAQGELDLAKQLAMQAKEMRDGASRACVREIDEASDAGIQPRNFWQKLGDAFKEIWNIICEVAKWVALVAGIIGMILGGPLAWIALAAGAILLIKAIVDFSQGKGSVMDLVFGLLGVIPGVKGLTSLSKLSALYKAGGMKEIGKAALNGMKIMAKDMVNLVKAAGQGAVTVVKALGDGSAAALAGLKNAGKVVTGAIDTGKVGDFIPAGLPKGGGPGFGALPTPTLPPVSVTPGKTFKQHFDDLAAVKTQTGNAHVQAIKNDIAGRISADKLKIEGVHAADLQVKVSKIDADAASKLAVDKLKIENDFKVDLKAQSDRVKVDAAADLSIAKGDLDLTFDGLRAAKLDEIKVASDAKFSADELAVKNASAERGAQIDVELKAINDQANEIKAVMQSPAAQADMVRFNEVYGGAMKHLDAENIRLLDAKANLPSDLAADLGKLRTDTAAKLSGDQAAALKELDIQKLDEITVAEKTSADGVKAEIENLTKNLEQQRDLDVQNLTNQIENTRLGDIKTAETQVDAAKNLDLANNLQMHQADELTEINAFTKDLDLQFDTANMQLNHQMLDSLGENVGTVKVLHGGSPYGMPGDLGTVIEKNLPKLDQINPNKMPTDVNCTICVQRVDDYVKTDTITIAPKIPTTRPLHTIEANYPGMQFQQVPGANYATVVADMAAASPGTVGIIGYKIGGTTDGHVMNVFNKDGRIMFVDGQTGGLGHLPPLTNPGSELWFTRIP
ncbi:toxin glutamine deamidase domain-containing protein [Catenuloplanes sp. NPDC051500]|uniref:toxin glutamine deamidase domain-containing protein n=1 Tax=Catenuloplanes sp. NPDC051500 TaxID=3363959 RepID=UPI003788CB72